MPPTNQPATNTPTHIAKTINVTQLTQQKRHNLFRQHMTQDGFIGFIKKQDPQTKQTYYIFHYQNYPCTIYCLTTNPKTPRKKDNCPAAGKPRKTAKERRRKNTPLNI